ncbi:undecaprenyldiphospho-muramoylpentapeptide beta-N-acetylglucosaminyltransferase [Siccirubricoccus sp. KC 17139]|uniref:UDP-N-acetylglucosamine--N-acetylmuramyl-(pentapeptide) pyrophosphoryl-undecaprenol N-acetylglucosamine transferase n=1 Tax=Siccirubricoccus soli TaxID=2899147 RepID=A0ABT1DCQ8_9PROT|nr:undecaprenyldiphospho-muramoylpentapeptide beta-N-acetylglucosaminyltransferase [Siccirubricoccus soli]MCO6419720.1 undecaprenyldiphospho-muramoylpentapeptide beta-N-acetylglucosaminyltransferase [Siccirubricoccus soli]MCP2685855.1 undecaprenyldiphospho-muramoylpentapeptide beta-N-acetylglucosaminyltransferase [Siccirubricoccus soli]
MMRGPAVRPIVIAAGGTGGHLFPAEALAAELVARGERIALMTDARSTAFASPAFANAERFVLQGEGLSGRGVLRAARGAVALAAGTWQARRLLRRLGAAAVVGFGGYPSVPPLLAALGMVGRRPVTVLHEQNAVLGRANRLLGRRADALALSFAATRLVPAGARVTVVGNPVRPALAALAGSAYPVPEGAIRLLVLGGSLGARVFADVVPPAIAALPETLRQRLVVAQQCRPEDLGRVREAYAAAGIPADLSPFFPDVAGRLEMAHLVIARAGAGTVAELACAGRPAILVPLPHAIDDHQQANARLLEQAGAATVVRQADFTAERLGTELAVQLADPRALARAAASAARLAQPDAARSLADLVLSLVRARTEQEAL